MNEEDLHRAMSGDKDLRGADLTHCEFSAEDFHDVDFSNADLRSTDIRGANLTGCDFTGTLFDDAKLDYARVDPVLPDAVLEAMPSGYFIYNGTIVPSGSTLLVESLRTGPPSQNESGGIGSGSFGAAPFGAAPFGGTEIVEPISPPEDELSEGPQLGRKLSDSLVLSGGPPTADTAPQFSSSDNHETGARASEPDPVEPQAVTEQQQSLRTRLVEQKVDILLATANIAKLAGEEIIRIESAPANDPDTIAEQQRQLQVLVIFRDHSAEIAESIVHWIASPAPPPEQVAETISLTERLKVAVDGWLDEHGAEAVQTLFRTTALGACFGALAIFGVTPDLAASLSGVAAFGKDAVEVAKALAGRAKAAASKPISDEETFGNDSGG